MFKFRNICGALVSADTQIVATDLATKTGGKMHLSLSRGETYTKAFGIADAAEDGEAAKMLANEITSALCADTVQNMNQVVGILKSKMTEWYAAYGQNRPPSTQFVFAAAVGGSCELFYCSPPNTVLPKNEPFAVGQGARPIEPLFPSLPAFSQPSAESALLRTAYWMYRAKRDEGSMCGGPTAIFMISQYGKAAPFGGQEVKAAEELGAEVDELLQQCRYSVLNGTSEQEQRSFLGDFSNSYLALAAKARDIAFPTLQWLEGTSWATQSASQKSEPAQ